MINASDFSKIIDKKFWDHIISESTYLDVVKWQDLAKDDFLKELANSLNTFSHSFQSPEYIFFSKDFGILRRVKCYNISDTCIYYYCLKSIQTEIVNQIKSIPHIYGGFRLSPDLKLKKEDLEKLTFDPLYETFAKNNFRYEWSDYQNLAKALSDQSFDFYIHIDIAHFYDDINFDILEKHLRDVSTKGEVIDLLFYFLRNSDKRDLGYFSNNTGVPQEEVGEMSRLLANFYLHEFDERINIQIGKVLKHEDFIFTRYADDMWIAFRGEKLEAERITQTVSAELLKLKLHINEKKIKFLTKDQFDEHWHFDTWDKVFLLKKDYDKTYKLINKCYANQKGRWFSPFFYALKSFTSDDKNVKLINKSKSESFLSMLINTPKLAYKHSNIPYPFFKAFFIRFPKQKTRIVELLKENKFIHPHIEYFILSLLSLSCDPLNEIFEILFDFYFKAVQRYPQWFSRIICVSFFIKHESFLIADHTRRDKLLKHFDKGFKSHNQIERRYNLVLINKLVRFAEAKELIKNTYNHPNDLKFVDYLSLNPSVI